MTLLIKRNLLSTSRFRKDIKSLDKLIQLEAFDVATILCSDISSSSHKIKKLTGCK